MKSRICMLVVGMVFVNFIDGWMSFACVMKVSR